MGAGLGKTGVAIPVADVAASFQEAVVEVLVKKTLLAAKQTGINTVVIGGGVAANSRLRSMATSEAEKVGVSIRIPRRGLCTDNGAMIAYAGCQRLLAGQQDEGGIETRARWPMEQLPPIALKA